MKKLNVLAGVFLISLLAFVASCVTKECQVTQTYYETEMRQEAYTATEQYEIKTPHSATIFQIEDEYLTPHLLFLFNHDSDGTVRWSSALTSSQQGKTFKPEPEGRNHRICLTAPRVSVASPEYATDQAVVVGLMTGRQQAAMALGFKPREPACPEAVFGRAFAIQLHPDLVRGLRMARESLIATLEGIEYEIPTYRARLLADYPDKQEVIERLYPVPTNHVATVLLDLCRVGYFGSPSEIVKEEDLSALQHPIEFSFDEMFDTDAWALIYITSLPFETRCYLTMSIDYVWDDVEIGTREVTKYRDVPVQVEKQRTVTETRQVPFWEATFGE